LPLFGWAVRGFKTPKGGGGSCFLFSPKGRKKGDAFFCPCTSTRGDESEEKKREKGREKSIVIMMRHRGEKEKGGFGRCVPLFRYGEKSVKKKGGGKQGHFFIKKNKKRTKKKITNHFRPRLQEKEKRSRRVVVMLWALKREGGA